MKFPLTRQKTNGYDAFWCNGVICLCPEAIEQIEPLVAKASQLTLIVERQPFPNSQEFLIWFDECNGHYHYQTINHEKGYFIMAMNELINNLLFDSRLSYEKVSVHVGIELT